MKECPYCAEDIQDSAIKCKHCGEFFEGGGGSRVTNLPDNVGRVFGGIGAFTKKAEGAFWEALLGPSTYVVPRPGSPVTLLDVTFHVDHFIYQSRSLRYTDICRLNYYSYAHVVNSVSSGETSLGITVRNEPSSLVLKAGSWFGFFNKLTFPVRNAYAIVRPLSVEARWTYYVEELLANGFIQYDDHVKIFRDGRLQRKSRTVDLRKAFQRSAFAVGTKESPFMIAVSEQGLGVFDGKLKFEATYDLDILPGLLRLIAEGKLGQRTLTNMSKPGISLGRLLNTRTESLEAQGW
jgi:hypothetical protein